MATDTSPRQSRRLAAALRAAWVFVICSTGLAIGCAHNKTQPGAYSSPEAAANSLISAVRSGDPQEVTAVLGPGSEEIVNSGDPVADKRRRDLFLTMYEQKHQVSIESEDTATLTVGSDGWPFPVPIVKRDDRWAFDCEAGTQEILNRRIGQNELSAMQVCRAIADAQREYAMLDPDHDGIPTYAQRFASEPGRRNGLYWPITEGEEPSPLGELAASAAAEGYARSDEGPRPYHGYYYRILTGQGPNASGGDLQYVVNGRMTLGYAVVAYPAEYGNSGIMTFVMGPDGVVYQQDLGPDTAAVASRIGVFDPDPSWTRAE